MSAKGLCTDNYPDGIDGTHPHFNPPNDPECQCGATLDWEWDYCPWCGEYVGHEEYDAAVGDGDDDAFDRYYDR